MTPMALVAEFEKKDKDPEIVEEGGQFFGRGLDFAMDKYNYYMCFKCQKPYFGGERACGAGGGDDYDPTELVCAGCSGGTAEVCPKHGTDYLEYKCRYCCSVACWFCFGTTHFCDPCHNRAGHNVPKPCPSVNEKELPPGTPCPLGCVHPENGQEFALGCGLCRNLQSF